MQPYILISIVVFALLIVGVLIFAFRARKTDNGLDLATQEKRPQGYWMGVGICIGIALGAGFWPIFDNIGVGIGIGVAIGTAIGASLEQKHRDETRPLTEQEKKMQKWGVALGLVTLLVLAGILVLLLITRIK